MSEYKLVYFGGRGHGEVARLILHHEGIEFEDVRISMKTDWPGEYQASKFFKNLYAFIRSGSEAPFGKLPYLEENGKRLPEGHAICRYLAQKYGLAGKDEWEQAWVNAIADMVKDFVMTTMLPFVPVALGMEEGDKDKLTNDTFLPALEAFAEQLEKLLAESKSGFLVNSGYTYVDFLVAENLLTCECCVPGCLDGHPKLKEYKERVFSIDKIKEYIASRKESPW